MCWYGCKRTCQSPTWINLFKEKHFSRLRRINMMFLIIRSDLYVSKKVVKYLLQIEALRKFQAVSTSTNLHAAPLPKLPHTSTISSSSLLANSSMASISCLGALPVRGERRRLLFLPGGNIRLKLLPTFWFRLVTRLLLLPKLRFTYNFDFFAGCFVLTWLLLLLFALMLLLMFNTEIN